MHIRFVQRGWSPDEIDPTREPMVRLLSTPLFHIGGLGDLLATHIAGEVLVLTTGRFDAGNVLEVIERERIGAWGTVPTMVSRVLDHATFSERDLSQLRTVYMGGSPVAPALRERLARALPHLARRSGVTWGMTETCGAVTTGAGAEIDSRPYCVGRIAPTIEVDVADQAVDGLGELRVRAPTLMSGYRGSGPLGLDPGGWLRTGDVGRIDSEGFVYVTGRRKDIIIRGGENVSAASVEAWLAEQPEIAAAAVVGLPDADLGEAVAAAVVLRPDAEITPTTLRDRARGALASYSIPTRWQIGHQPLPTNDVGKIDKRVVIAQWNSSTASV
jgi:long-chain acyl-CoA synthetase